MTGLVILLCGIGVGFLIGAAFFGGPPANLSRERGVRGFHSVPLPPPPVSTLTADELGRVHGRH